MSTTSQCAPLHLYPSSIGLNIVDTLKQTKSMKKSTLDLTSIDFDNMEVIDDKYLPSFFLR